MDKKILIVEDEGSQRTALQRRLAKEGFTVIEAADGEEGVSAAIKECPDLVVMDIMMPKLDGLEAAKKLRADATCKDIPILILSNIDDMDRVQAAMEAGVFEYFVKSDTTLEHVVEKVKELLHV